MMILFLKSLALHPIALMFALGAFCTHFGERNENEDTIEFFDEAWILMKSEKEKPLSKICEIGRAHV